ncbi:calcium-binding protein [Pseudomonas petrae]|uniref:calcium-binding protein n=1 Tax=Pseudomonas petrae TaxID=2912190 RepID=UPI001F2D0044|nr:calcium-binding protein [Pseudomonas petrae]
MNTNASTSVLTHTVTTGVGTVSVDLTGQLDYAESVLVNSNGQILVGGYSQHLAWGYPGAPGEESYGYELDHSVVRLDPNGRPDTAFGEGGVDVVPASIDLEWDYGIMAVQPDGRVVAAHSVEGGIRVERFNSDGTLDSTFGKDGAQTIATDLYGGMDLKAQADGTVYVSIRGTGQVEVTKLSSDGAVITGFGDQGTLALNTTSDLGSGDISTSVQPDGSVLLGALYMVEVPHDSPTDIRFVDKYALQRFMPDGELDIRFGDQGKLYLDTALGFRSDSEVTVQVDGKIIVVGHDIASSVSSVLRLNADGSFDTSFGEKGMVTIGDSSPDAVTVQADGKIVVAGLHNLDFSITRLNADGSLDTTFGSQDGKVHIDGYVGQDILRGTEAAELINGFAGDDVLQGNGGQDVLTGGAGADIFRFTDIADSYRTSTGQASDRILDFDASQDRIDLIGLGFTGLGNGHNGTLAVQTNAEGTRTYLKSYDADASGHRFELVLDGNLASQLNSDNVVTARPVIEGTSGGDTITGSALSEVINGLAGNDRINGGAGSDILIGGQGADQLNGGDRGDFSYWVDDHQDDDIFRYLSTDDSYRTDSKSFVDLIIGFAGPSDKIDVSQLGYTEFGDGTGTTLKMAYNGELDRTYLKDVDADNQGHRFEIALAGNWLDVLNEDNMVFAPVVPVKVVGAAATLDPSHYIA